MKKSRVSIDRDRAKRSAKDRFTPAQIVAALKASGGVRLAAARMLRCSPSTITNYVGRYADIAEACLEIEHTRRDIAETILLKTMANDDNPRLQFKAATYYLKNSQRFGRGGGKAVEPRCRFDLSRLSNDELTTLQRLLKKAEISDVK